MPSWTVPMKRTGLSMMRMRDPRAPHASVCELLEARASRRHERVLGRDEEAVREHDQENGEELERNRHAPFSGAQVLGGSSSSKMLRANYR